MSMSYDFFALVYKNLQDKTANEEPEKFSARFNEYANKRNLSNIVADLLDITRISPGFAWQVAELAFPFFKDEIPKCNEILNNEINILNTGIDRSQPKDKDRLLGKKRHLISCKRNLEELNTTNPVWGKPKGEFSLLDFYTLDDDEFRKETILFPPLCFRLKLTVPMKTPIVIKGDRPFVANENPFCIDKVTGWPLIRPSSLKGQARHATFAFLKGNEKITNNIFGSANEETGEGHRGRFEFLPCYLKKEISFDVLAPHDEKTRRVAKSGPVSIEVLNADRLPLWLQYWPFDHLNNWLLKNDPEVPDRLFDDFWTILSGLNYWFREVGIGAKTSSGYGQVKWEEVEIAIFSSEASPWNVLKGKDPFKLKDLLNQTDLKTKWDKSWQETTTQTNQEVVNHAG